MSRFIAFAFPVATAEEAKSAIAAIANEYHDARHVCWAYLLGPGGREWLSSDNGEPSGTAGKPILGQIRSAGLTNVAVVVVRYFLIHNSQPTRFLRQLDGVYFVEKKEKYEKSESPVVKNVVFCYEVCVFSDGWAVFVTLMA